MARTTGLYIMVARTFNGRTERFTKKIIQTDSCYDMLLEYGDIPNVQKYEFVDYFGEDINNLQTNFKGKFIVIKGKYVTSIVYPIKTTRRRIKRNVEKVFKILTRHGVPEFLDRFNTDPAVIGE